MRVVSQIFGVALLAAISMGAARSTPLIDAVKNGDATTVRAALRAIAE